MAVHQIAQRDSGSSNTARGASTLPGRLANRAPAKLGRWPVVAAMLAAVFTLGASDRAMAATDGSTPPAGQAAVRVDLAWGRMPLCFVANQGQVDGSVAYYVQGGDKTLYFSQGGVTFALIDPTASNATERDQPLRNRNENTYGWTVDLEFVGADSVTPRGETETGTVVSYFTGSPDEWQTGLPTYSSVVYAGLWEGIDLRYSGTFDRLKHEFIVRPGADPGQIRLAYHGATVTLNGAGQLEVGTPAGGFTDDAPVAYQEIDGRRVPVAVRYGLESAGIGGDGAAGQVAQYGFLVGEYDPTLPLVIDPAVIVYCGLIEGRGTSSAGGVAVDSTGCAYVVGETTTDEESFPVTVGPDLTFSGWADAFVAKVRADGTGFVYVGYIGGEGYDYATGVAVDPAGCAYVMGDTHSTEATFPVTVGPDLTFNGGPGDGFVAKVTADGTGLAYCGYIGGAETDEMCRIAVDAGGSAYVAGSTTSNQSTFPVLGGPDVTHNGFGDVFVAKVKADGTGLAYCGYIGCPTWDGCYGVAVDSGGSAYVAGWTEGNQTAFPVAVGPDLTSNGGFTDAFVAKVKADGSGLDYCGYIGGSGREAGLDEGGGIAVDAAGNAYVTGITASTEATFPVAVGPDLSFNGGSLDTFVAKVKADGTALDYCGYIGGNDLDHPAGIAVDAAGDAYVTGTTFSTEASFPVVAGPDPTHNGGSWEAFVARVKADGTALDYCGYIGGASLDEGMGIAVDSGGSAYVVGETWLSDWTFPVLVGPDLSDWGGVCAFVAKVSTNAPSAVGYVSLRGTDRYDTAIKISKASFPGGLPTNRGLVLAPGETYQEALCGAPLAAALGGPVLLTPGVGLNNAVKAEIQRLKPRYVVCIGLSDAIMNAVQAALGPSGVASVITGTSVYDMSLEVARALGNQTGGVGTAIITRGDLFPDAIAVSPLACAKKWPIVLTHSATGALHEKASEALGNLSIEKALKVGTYATLPNWVTGLANLSGADRYVTDKNVAVWAKNNAGMTFANIGIATGDKFPDALAAGPYLALTRGILLLSPLYGPLPPAIGSVISANASAVRRVSFIAMIEPVISQVKACLP